MLPIYNGNNVVMNITKYKLFPTFLIKMDLQRYNHRDQLYKNFEFLSIYYQIAFHKDGVCNLSTSKVHIYTNMEVFYHLTLSRNSSLKEFSRPTI